MVCSARKRRLHVYSRIHGLLSTKTPTKQRQRQRRWRTQTPLDHHVRTHLTSRRSPKQQQHFPSLQYDTQSTKNFIPIKPQHHPPPLRLLLRLSNPLPPPPNRRNPHALRKRPSRHDRSRDNSAVLPVSPRIHFTTTRNPTKSTTPARIPRSQTHTGGFTETPFTSFDGNRSRWRRNSTARTPAQPRNKPWSLYCAAKC